MPTTAPTAPPPDDPFGGERVLDESGRIHATDAPVDLSGYRWEDWLTLGFFFALGLTVFYQFFTRYVLENSAGWTEEIARYLLVAVTFLGASMAVRRNSHIHVEFLYQWLPAAAGRVLSTAVDGVRIAFYGYATWLSVDLMPRMANLNMTVVDLPMSYVYGLVTLGFAMMTFRSVQVALRHWRRGWSLLERPGETEA